VSPRSVQARRDDVRERDELGHVAVESDLVHPVVVSVGNEEAVLVRLHRVLDARRDEVVRGGRVRDRERADVRDDREAARAVDPVDAVHGASTHVGADERDERVGGVPDEGDVHDSAEADLRDLGRQPAREGRLGARVPVDARDAPGLGLGDVEVAAGAGADRAARASVQT
jgi:hypothetical protein